MAEHNEHHTFKTDEIAGQEISDPDFLSKNPLVSVCTTTYNHKAFISQAIEGALIQKTDFPYEILIGEDDSTDGTREICKEHAAKHPDKIRLFLNNRKDVIYINGSPTGRWNLINLLRNSKGKYIAICEGDDYWIDPLKLQKQVEFLEGNAKYSMCFHNVVVANEVTNDNHLFYKQKLKNTHTINDLAKGPFFATCSVVLRKKLIKNIPNWFVECAVGDWPLFMIVSEHGDLHYICDVMSVRRQHSNGYWHVKNKENQYKGLIETVNLMKKNFDLGIQKQLNNTISNYYRRIAQIMSNNSQHYNAIRYTGRSFIIAPKFTIISLLKAIFR